MANTIIVSQTDTVIVKQYEYLTTDQFNVLIISNDLIEQVEISDVYDTTIEINDVSKGTDGVNGIDGIGLQSGGLTDQILTKNSAVDYDCSWKNKYYKQDFNSTTDWTLDIVNNKYYINIDQLTHLRSLYFIVQIFQLSNVDNKYHVVDVNDTNIDTNGNLEFSVTSVPDNRFSGRVIIL